MGGWAELHDDTFLQDDRKFPISDTPLAYFLALQQYFIDQRYDAWLLLIERRHGTGGVVDRIW